MPHRLVRKSDGREVPAHDWDSPLSGPRTCRKCGMASNSPERTSNRRHPELCFFTRLGICGKCGKPDRPLTFEEDPQQSDRYCVTCLYPFNDDNVFMTAKALLQAMSGMPVSCQAKSCGHTLTNHKNGLRCLAPDCSCERYEAKARQAPS